MRVPALRGRPLSRTLGPIAAAVVVTVAVLIVVAPVIDKLLSAVVPPIAAPNVTPPEPLVIFKVKLPFNVLFKVTLPLAVVCAAFKLITLPLPFKVRLELKIILRSASNVSVVLALAQLVCN